MLNTHFMQDLEKRYGQAAGLENRSQYKLFYCAITESPILTLGINPGGDPAETSADGMIGKNGMTAAASSSFYENGEHDILDCQWQENTGLRKLLSPLLGGDLERIRTEVVKTNLAFRRSRSKGIKQDIARDIEEAAPFLSEMIQRIMPSLVLLTGADITKFLSFHAVDYTEIVPAERDAGIGHVVFQAGRATLLSTGSSAIIVRVAHASQFSWTYSKYDVAQRILDLIKS